MRATATVFTIYGTIVGLAWADESSGALRGIGYADCNQFRTWVEDPLAQEAIVSWIHGYWSATNEALHIAGKPMKNIFDSTVDPEPLKAQLVAVCADEPQTNLSDVADRIFGRLPDYREEQNP
mgnify:FL=1